MPWLFASACLSLPFAASVAALDAAAPLDFAIPAQPLSSALIAYGKQADVQVLTAGNSVAAARTAGASGSLSPKAALDQLLRGTGLDYETDAGTVVVKPARRLPGLAPPSLAMTSATRSPTASAVALTPVQVRGMALDEHGYLVDSTRSATRSETALSSLPQSVSVVTRELIDSRQALTLADALESVAGVQYLAGADGLPLFSIRGFNAGNGMTDGMPNGVARTGDLPPLIGIERVEVLKGPEAILGEASSDNSFGGSINLVMKQPQSQPLHQLSYALGQYGGVQAGIDLAGPLGNRGDLDYRLVAAGQDAQRTPQGYRGQRGSYYAPSIAWHDQNTRVTLGLEHVDNRIPVADHAVLLGASLSSLSPFGELPGHRDDHAQFRTDRLSFSFERALGGDWILRSRGQYVHQHRSGQNWLFDNGTPSGLVDAVAETYRYSDAYYTWQNDLSTSFEQGPLVHSVLLGLDYARSRAGEDGQDDSLVSSAKLSYNMLSDVALPTARAETAASPATVQRLGGAWSSDLGLFLQDQIAIGEQWDALLALRRTSYELNSRYVDGQPRRLRREEWVPHVGLVYKATTAISLYTSLTHGFQPNSLLGDDGQPLPPARSRQLEIGAKFDLFDQRARLTTAWYRTTLDHSVNLISPAPPYFATPGPGQRNHGVELELNGELAPGLSLSASYSRASIHNRDGTPATGTSTQQFTSWISYRFQQPLLQAWGIAAGVQARSRALGQLSEQEAYFSIPGQASVDANLSYYATHWRATLGVRNLFARTLYGLNFDDGFVPLRQARTVMLSGTYDF